MANRRTAAEEEREREAPSRGGAGDLGVLPHGTGNAALAGLMRRIESGAAPASALLPGATDPDVERAEEAEDAMQALAAVDFARRPLSERIKKALMERTAVAKPGMLLYAPDDFNALYELQAKLAEVEKRLIDNGIAVTTARSPLETSPNEVATAYALRAAATLAEDVRKAGQTLQELELRLTEVSDRHAHANAEDRARLDRLMDGLEPRLRREPRLALSGGAGRQEIDYLLKRAWLEQHEATQRLTRDEVWQLITGFSSGEGGTCYFDLPERMDRWRVHFALEHGAMRSVAAGSSDQEIRDALLGATAGVVTRAHATAEVLGRSDHRNPRYYYGTSRVTPRREFWGTREGKSAKRNWSANQSKLMEAFDAKADELVAVIHDVLEQRKRLKALVVKVGETLNWAG